MLLDLHISYRTKLFLAHLRSTLNDLSKLSIPTISVVTSNALGGGFELALATHLRIFTTVTMVGFPETQLGIIPGAGGTYRLRKLVSESRAHQIVLDGRNIHGRQAFEWGICNWCIRTDNLNPDQNNSMGNETEEAKTKSDVNTGSFDYKDGGARRSQAFSFALGVAKSICKGAPMAVAAALHTVRAANPAAEANMYNLCMTLGAGDRAEGLLAFKEKRLPIYRGAREPSKKAKSAKGVVPEQVSDQTESQIPRAEGNEGKVEDSDGVEGSKTLEDSEGSRTSGASDPSSESESKTLQTLARGDERAESATRDKEEQQ